jgi:hypothetical protein
MRQEEWNSFKKARDKFRNMTEELSASLPKLKSIQQKFVDSRSVSESKSAAYTVETPVVYNTALDGIKQDDEIRLILVGDNPGRREQAAENRRYLVGHSGKIAQKFFRDNPSLGIDFQKNVIILNKTPIHSPRTIELRQLCRLEAETGGSSLIAASLESSQKFMAGLLFDFHAALNAQVWIVGYSEMKKGGLFETYTEKLKELYAKNKLCEKLFLYRHFSMNQFTIDLKQQAVAGETTAKSLKRIGEAYRKKILNI